MGKQIKNYVVLFNICTIIVVSLQVYVLGQFFRSMNLVLNPLFVTETCMISFTIWNLVGFYTILDAYPISVGFMFM